MRPKRLRRVRLLDGVVLRRWVPGPAIGLPAPRVSKGEGGRAFICRRLWRSARRLLSPLPGLQQPVLDQPHRAAAPRVVGAHAEAAVGGGNDVAGPGVADLKAHHVFGAGDSLHDAREGLLRSQFQGNAGVAAIADAQHVLPGRRSVGAADIDEAVLPGQGEQPANLGCDLRYPRGVGRRLLRGRRGAAVLELEIEYREPDRICCQRRERRQGRGAEQRSGCDLGRRTSKACEARFLSLACGHEASRSVQGCAAAPPEGFLAVIEPHIAESGKPNASWRRPGKFHDGCASPPAVLFKAPVLPLNSENWVQRNRGRRTALRAEHRSPGGPSRASPMGTAAKSDLKVRLTMQIVAVAVACLAAMSAWALLDADRSARARIDRIAVLVANDLQLQRDKMHWISDPAAAFPDLQTIAAAVMTPGLCIAYRANDGNVVQRFCGGVRSGEPDPPAAFSALYRRLFDPGSDVVRPVMFKGGRIGEAVVRVDPAALTAEAWNGAGRLLAVMGVTLLLLCCLVHAALARALRPTRLIRAGLERMAANDLTARLPPFDLAELSAIGAVFNHLAESLQRTLDERSELTRRLIALQDDERRHLARELHDEFGQCLAAIRALTASASQTAALNCPAILADCAGIERTAARMAETLRGALFRLRPPDVEELGLAASLESLVAGWNVRSRGGTRFEIRLCGEFDDLPPVFSAGLYRIAQEAITNAAKHADATRVVLQLTESAAPASGSRSMREIELTVDDDGKAGEAEPAAKPGMGLLGMRERVATLGGRLSFEAGTRAASRTGSVLRVVVPVKPAAATGRAVESECPA